MEDNYPPLKQPGLILFSLFTFYTSVSAQVYCDSSLISNTRSPLGYHDRGGRCEGLYVKQVASTTLLVVSLTESFEQYDPALGKPLQMDWGRTPGNGGTRIRAQGIRRKLYYRMDAVRPAGETSFAWPSNVLASLSISKEDLGVLASTQYTVGDQLRDVYLPVRISQVNSNSHSPGYKLILLPGVELTKVYVSLALIGPDGRSKQFVKDGEKLEYGYYPAERGIEIPITGLKGKGTYYMEIGAGLRDGGTSTIELWFYNEIQ
jgi:hypothetical protein